MRAKQVIAASVSVAMLLGVAGCDMFGIRQDMGVMYDRITRYNQALNNLDYETIRDLTDWTEEDSDYTAIETLFDTSYYGDIAGEGFVDCTKYVASTINIKFDVTGARIDGNFASLDVKYDLVYWQSVYSELHDSYEAVLDDLKSSQHVYTIESTITLENVNGSGDWRLCRINDLNELMSFVYTLPEVTAPEPEEDSGLYDAAIDSYVYTLSYCMNEIEKTEAMFGVNTCGIYDIDNDGIPELYYLAEDREGMSCKLCVCYYLDFAGEAVEGITSHNFINVEYDNKEFSCFVTDKEIVIVHGTSEGETFSYVADVYGFDLNLNTRYYCAQQYDYDPATGEKVLVTRYLKGDSTDMTEEEFMNEVRDYTGRAQAVLLGNFQPFGDSTFDTVPVIGASACHDEIMYLKSLIE